MIKRTITFVDPFDNETKTEDFYFHFTEMELLRLKNDHKDLQGEIAQVSNGTATQQQIIALFEEFVSKSFGERTPEGRFVKSKEITDAFLVSEPYSTLVTGWFAEEGGGDAAAFMNGLMPKNLQERAEAREKEQDQPSAERVEELKKRVAPRKDDIVVEGKTD